MRGYVIVLYTFAIYLVQGSHAFLPKFVYRVSKCPDPNNITEWEEASRKLVCLHPIRGGSSKQLSRVYHCLPSIFLNESVEYCGNSGPVTEGHCPVYSYGDGRNRAATHILCTNFTEGCPETQYHSKDVYTYPACLNINPIEKCYVAEPTCYEIKNVTNITDISSTESDIEDDTNDNIAVTNLTDVLSTESDIGDHKNVNIELVISIPLLEIIIVCAVLGLILGLILWKKKLTNCSVRETARDQQARQRGSVGTGASETSRNPLLGNEDTENPKGNNDDPLLQNNGIEDVQDDVLQMKLDLFLGNVGQRITRETLEKLKFYLKGCKNGIDESETQMIDGITSGMEVINFLHRIYDFNINLYILQSMLENTKEKDLAKSCIKFAKKTRRMYYYEGHAKITGYREIILKIEKNIDEYTTDHIEGLRKRLSSLAGTSDPKDIVFKKIDKGCIAIHALVRQNLVDIIKSADLSSLHHDCVMEVKVVGECIRSLRVTGTDWVDPEDPAMIAESELLTAAKSIEAAAQKLSQIKPRKKAKEADMSLKLEEQTLETAKSIAFATAASVKSASAVQQELVAQGKIGATYHKSQILDDDGQWSEGLISAAKMVAAATHSLCESANAMVQGHATQERVIASTKKVTELTDDMLVVCRVKADPDSCAMKRLLELQFQEEMLRKEREWIEA